MRLTYSMSFFRQHLMLFFIFIYLLEVYRSQERSSCPCLDVPPPKRLSAEIPSCEKQREWGKCGARWMEGWCKCTCGTCQKQVSTRPYALFDDYQGDPSSLPEYNISTFESRTRVNITSYPFSIIGQLGEVCTAALIGPCQIITAAHCLMDPRSQTWWADFDSFAPGRNGHFDWNPHGKIGVLKTFVPRQWIDDFNTAYDIGIVLLDQRIGDELGYFKLGQIEQEAVLTSNGMKTEDLIKHTFGIMAANYHNISGGYRARGVDTEELVQVLKDQRGSFSLAGYPSTETDDSMYYQYCEGVTIDYARGMLFLHLCEAGSGVSGGPMWMQKSDGTRELIAIHGGEVHLRDGELGLAGSYATLVTEEMRDVIKEWMSSDAACQQKSL